MDTKFTYRFEFCRLAEQATATGEKLKFPKYTKTLSYNSEGIYNFEKKIANLDLNDKTIQARGYWNPIKSKRYNYVKIILHDRYGFKEIETSSSSTEETGTSSSSIEETEQAEAVRYLDV